MQSIPANEIFQKVDARQLGMMVRFYRATEVDADFDRLQAENKMLHETAQKANRLYSEAVSRAIEAEPLLHAVRALVEVSKKFNETGWTQRGWEDLLQKQNEAIAAVERHWENT